MKRFILILSFLLISPVFADSWDDFSAIDSAWDGQKTITNKEFEQAIESIEAPQKQKEEKKKTKLWKKISGGGTSLHNDLAPQNEITEVSSLKKNKDGCLVNIPVSLIIDEQVLDKGFYKVLGEKDENGDIYLSFYQSQFFKGKVRACETDDDFEQKTIDFAELTPYNNNFVRVIFGSLDFNAYAYIRYQQEFDN